MDLNKIDSEKTIYTVEKDEIIVSELNVWRMQELYKKTESIEKNNNKYLALLLLKYSIIRFNNIEFESLEIKKAVEIIENLKINIDNDELAKFIKWFILINELNDIDNFKDNDKNEYYNIKRYWLNDIGKREKWAKKTFGTIKEYNLPSVLKAYSSQEKMIKKVNENNFETINKILKTHKVNEDIYEYNIQKDQRKIEIENVILNLPESLSKLNELQALSNNANIDLINASNEILRKQVKQSEKDSRFSKFVSLLALVLSILSIIAALSMGFLQLKSNDKTTNILKNIENIISNDHVE